MEGVLKTAQDTPGSAKLLISFTLTGQRGGMWMGAGPTQALSHSLHG